MAIVAKHVISRASPLRARHNRIATSLPLNRTLIGRNACYPSLQMNGRMIVSVSGKGGTEPKTQMMTMMTEDKSTPKMKTQQTTTTTTASASSLGGGGSRVEEERVKKTLAELDEDLRRKMEGLAGDGGEAGVELENGQPVAMKRSVRENMFRYI